MARLASGPFTSILSQSLSLSLLLLISLLLSPPSICSASTHSEVEDESSFSYMDGSGKGPERCGEIDPHWRVCNDGEMQSPIDLFNTRVVWKGDAGKININGTNYKLIQCHWHSPVEHIVNGTRYNMELNLVHKSSDEKIAIVGIIYKYGRPNHFIKGMIHHMYSISNENFVAKEENDLSIVNPGDIRFGSRKYYQYISALTIPPCTEGVVWTIVKKVRTVSREQVRLLREAVHDGYEANARPTQQVGDRPILLYS